MSLNQVFFRILIRCTPITNGKIWICPSVLQYSFTASKTAYGPLLWRNSLTKRSLNVYKHSTWTEMKPDIRQLVLYLIHKHSWGQTRPCSLSRQTRQKCSPCLSLPFNEVWWIDFLMIKTQWNVLTTLLLQQQTKFRDPGWASIDRRKWLIISD